MNNNRVMLWARIFSVVAISGVVYFEIEQEDVRYALMAVLGFGLLPLVLLLEHRFPYEKYDWAAPIPDLLVLLALVHVVPDRWHVCMCIGLMLALAPVISSSPMAHRIYLLLGVTLVAGMSFAGWHHQVPDWHITIAVVSIIYPALFVYARTVQVNRLQLEGRSQALSSLNLIAGSVAHRLSNAMMTVTGNLELAMKDLPQGHPERRYLEDALEGAGQSGQTARQLASFSGGTIAEKRELLVNSELEIISGLMRLILPDGIELDYSAPAEATVVTGNRFQLQQVIMTAVLRVSEKMKAPGRIQMNCTNEAKLILDIRDASVDRPGYQPLESVRYRVFEEKTRHHLQTLDAETGRIQVASEDGRVVAVRIVLLGQPLDEPAAPMEVDVKRVLVIDDEEAVRKTLTAMLEHLECEVSAAASGEEGLKLLEDPDQRIDQVFLDLKMPGMDGWECLERIRVTHPDLPVTIASGYDPRPERDRPDVQVRYLQKPFTIESLRRSLSGNKEAA